MTAKQFADFHSVGDVHDHLKGLHSAALEVDWPTPDTRRVVLRLPTGDAFAATDVSVAAATEKLWARLDKFSMTNPEGA